MATKGGQPKNDNYTRGAIFNDALRKCIVQDNGKRIRAAAEKLLDLAADGTPWAVRELADRTDGKAFQAVQIVGDSENPLEVKVSHGMDKDAEALLKKIRGIS